MREKSINRRKTSHLKGRGEKKIALVILGVMIFIAFQVFITSGTDWSGFTSLIYNDTLNSSNGWNPGTGTFNATGLMNPIVKEEKQFVLSTLNITEIKYQMYHHGTASYISTLGIGNMTVITFDTNNLNIAGDGCNAVASAETENDNLWNYVTVQINSTNVSVWYQFNSEPDTSLPPNATTLCPTIDLTNDTFSFVTNDANEDVDYRNLEIHATPQPTTTVTLNTPDDGSTTTNSSISFNASGEDQNSSSFSNATLHVWFNNGTLHGLNTTSLSVNETDVIRSMGGLLPDKTYKWNYRFCNGEDFCAWASNNFTFSRERMEITGESYANTTSEGSVESFQLNATLNSDYRVSTANLVYDGTSYSGTFTKSGDDYVITRSLDIPSVASTLTKNFTWNITFDDGGVENSTTGSISVEDITLDDGTSNTILILNYTLKDEDTQSNISATATSSNMQVNVEIYPSGSSTLLTSFSQGYSSTNPAQVYINKFVTNTTAYDMFVTTQYTANGYVVEKHHLQKVTLNNATSPRNINLLLLNDTRSTEFEIVFKDSTLGIVADALIDITREYVSNGTFKSVEIGKTDNDGKTVGHLVKEDVTYTIIVTKNGVVLATFPNVIAFCDDQTIGDCRLNLNEKLSATNPEDYTTRGGLTYEDSWDQSTKTLTVTFTTTDGDSRFVQLNGTKYDMFGNNSVCSDSLTSSSGTLTCTIPNSFGNITTIFQFFAGSDLIFSKFESSSPSGADIFGPVRIFLVLILLITLPLMAISSTIAVVVFSALGFVIAISLSLLDGSVLGSGSALVWFIVGAIIIVFKISNRRSG